MYTYREQIEIVKAISLSNSTSRTMTCPFCGGRDKFSLSRSDGTLLWNCYRAGCTSRGSFESGYSLADARAKMLSTPPPNRSKHKPLPPMLVSVTGRERVLDYLQSNNCMYAYENNLVTVKYAPAEDRCLFFMNGGTGAVGRSLSGAIPKWMVYGNTSGVLPVGHSDHAVLVEDACSACAVAATGTRTGVAILGTKITKEQKQLLRSYKTVTICLDKDANSTAVSLYRQLSGLIAKVTVRLIPRDLKYCDRLTIERILDNEV